MTGGGEYVDPDDPEELDEDDDEDDEDDEDCGCGAGRRFASDGWLEIVATRGDL